MPGKPRSEMTQEEREYNDALDAQIEEELDLWDDHIVGMQLGHIPGGFPEGWDDSMEAAYVGESLEVKAEGRTDSSPEEWREFLRKIEEDLDS